MVNIRLKQLKNADLATIIYTSGTTGEPKGVMLTHENYLQAFKIHEMRLTKYSDRDVSMCFLPLTHIFEKAWTYLCIEKGIAIAINKDPSKIQENLCQVRPTLMCSVPRFWEKVYEGVQDQIESYSGNYEMVAQRCRKNRRKHNLEYRNKGKKAPIGNSLKFFLYKNTVFFIIKRIVGIDRGNFFPVAGAPLSDMINEFMQSIDVHLIYGYGLSETTATVSCFPHIGFTIGTVGKVMPEVDVRIGENNEILVKGKTVMKGYYNNQDETIAVFTDDGYFKTGDAGYLTENNEIVLTDRIKDLYKTSMEIHCSANDRNTIGEDKYIDQIAVIGNERKFVSALIVPTLQRFANMPTNRAFLYVRRGFDCKSRHRIFIYERVEMKQADFTSYEKIKRFTLLAQPFTMESGELTNTLNCAEKSSSKTEPILSKKCIKTKI
jgi:long-chain acyl-CoA synthetase